MHFRGLLTGVLFVILLLGSLLICRYTNSFGAWLPCVVLVGKDSSRYKKVLLASLSILLFVILALSKPRGAFLLYIIRTGSADVRLLIWSSSGEAFLKAPLFGYSSVAVQSP